MKLLLLCLLAYSFGFGQGRGRTGGAPAAGGAPVLADAPALRPEERCTVEGSVLNAATGEPLRKVSISLRRLDARGGGGPGGISYAATTDASGRYTISGIEPGRYRLSAERAGFVDQQYGAKGPSQAGSAVALEKSQRLTDATIKMTPHGVIAGRVLDPDGDPVVNATLQVMKRGYVRGRKQMIPVDSASTNDIGEYRIYGLPPGKYVLSASYRRGQRGIPTQDSEPETFATTYYPGGTGPEMASTIDVVPGSQFTNIDIRLMKTRAVRVEGRVVMAANAGGGRNGGATIALVPKGGIAGMRNTTRPYNAQGDFMLNNVAPGSYTIVASQFENGQVTSARMPLEVGNGPVTGVLLQPSPGAELRGAVKVEGGTGTDLSKMRVSFAARTAGGSGMMGGPGAQGSGTVKADGTFSVSNVQPEHYDVRVSGLPDGSYIKSIKVGDSEALETGVDFSPGVMPGEIAVVVSLAAGALDGAVQSDKPELANGAIVVLVPEGRRSESDRFYVTATADATGHFSMKNITPGEYRLYAFDNVENGAYMDPDWMKVYEGRGERVSVKEGSRESVQPKLVATQSQ
jgi:protocatechuate 3,4-dioxygenase beta subunit